MSPTALSIRVRESADGLGCWVARFYTSYPLELEGRVSSSSSSSFPLLLRPFELVALPIPVQLTFDRLLLLPLLGCFGTQVTPSQFQDLINDINALLLAANSFSHAVVDNVLMVATFHLSLLVRRSHFEKVSTSLPSFHLSLEGSEDEEKDARADFRSFYSLVSFCRTGTRPSGEIHRDQEHRDLEPCWVERAESEEEGFPFCEFSTRLRFPSSTSCSRPSRPLTLSPSFLRRIGLRLCVPQLEIE